MAQGQRKSLLLSRQPRACQGNVLCTGLWMIYVNTLVNRSTAVDECCCGKVDNRCDTESGQVTGRPRPTGRYAVSTGQPARPPCPLLREGAKQSRRSHEKSRCPMIQLSLVTASRPVGIGVEPAMCMAARTGIWGYYRSGRQLLETIA